MDIGRFILVVTLAMVAWACPDKDGPLENAGERVDDAVEDLRGKESVGDKLKDAAEEVKEGVEDAKEELK